MQLAQVARASSYHAWPRTSSTTTMRTAQRDTERQWKLKMGSISSVVTYVYIYIYNYIIIYIYVYMCHNWYTRTDLILPLIYYLWYISNILFVVHFAVVGPTGGMVTIASPVEFKELLVHSWMRAGVQEIPAVNWSINVWPISRTWISPCLTTIYFTLWQYHILARSEIFVAGVTSANVSESRLQDMVVS